MENTVCLNAMADNAFQTMDSVGERIESVDEMLKARRGGTNAFGQIGYVIVCLLIALGSFIISLWLDPYVTAIVGDAWRWTSGPSFGLGFLGIEAHKINYITLVVDIIELMMTFLLAIQYIASMKFYQLVEQEERTVFKLRKQLREHRELVGVRLSEFLRTADVGWELPIHPENSVPDELDRIESAVLGLEKTSNKGIQAVLTPIYYVAAVLWSVFFILATFNPMVSVSQDVMALLEGGWDRSTLFGIVLVIGIISLCVQIWMSSLIVRWQGKTVNCGTMLAMLSGLACFWAAWLACVIVACLIAMVVVIVGALLKIVVGIIVVVVAGGIVIGLISGG